MNHLKIRVGQVFAFAQLNNLAKEETLYLFAEHYQSVLNKSEWDRSSKYQAIYGAWLARYCFWIEGIRSRSINMIMSITGNKLYSCLTGCKIKGRLRKRSLSDKQSIFTASETLHR